MLFSTRSLREPCPHTELDTGQKAIIALIFPGGAICGPVKREYACLGGDSSNGSSVGQETKARAGCWPPRGACGWHQGELPMLCVPRVPLAQGDCAWLRCSLDGQGGAKVSRNPVHITVSLCDSSWAELYGAMHRIGTCAIP